MLLYYIYILYYDFYSLELEPELPEEQWQIPKGQYQNNASIGKSIFVFQLFIHKL